MIVPGRIYQIYELAAYEQQAIKYKLEYAMQTPRRWTYLNMDVFFFVKTLIQYITPLSPVYV